MAEKKALNRFARWWHALSEGAFDIEAAEAYEIADLMDRLHALPLTPEQQSRGRSLILYYWGNTVLMVGVLEG
jgi:hypothetical protein